MESCFRTFENHAQEVCGLKWSPDLHYLASGGGDNIANVWEPNMISAEEPVCHYFYSFGEALVIYVALKSPSASSYERYVKSVLPLVLQFRSHYIPWMNTWPQSKQLLLTLINLILWPQEVVLTTVALRLGTSLRARSVVVSRLIVKLVS